MGAWFAGSYRTPSPDTVNILTGDAGSVRCRAIQRMTSNTLSTISMNLGTGN
jgi:hypothetical protein